MASSSPFAVVLLAGTTTERGSIVTSSSQPGFLRETGEEKSLSTQQRVDFRDARPEPGAGVNGARFGGERLPRPPGRRRPGLALLAVLLIVLGGAVAGLLALRIDQRQDVLVARSDIPAGQQIGPGDLAVAKMAAEGITAIPARQAADVVGKYAASTIPAGRLVDPGVLAASGLLMPGKAAVGIALKNGRFPAGGLQSGDVVQLVRSADGVGKTITSSAVVSSVNEPGEDSFSASGGDSITITVVVEQRLAAPVAAASAAEQVSVVLLRRGGGG